MTTVAFTSPAAEPITTTASACPPAAQRSNVPVRDEAWFAAIYESTFDNVFRYSSALTRNSHVAEDVTAETFLRVWRSRENYRGEGSVLAWILTIARNCATTALNSRKEELDLALIIDPEDPTLTQDADADSPNIEALQAALAELTAEQQQVIFLRFFKELPHEAVAAELGRNPAAVRAIQFRALHRMRKLMEAGHAR